LNVLDLPIEYEDYDMQHAQKKKS